MAGILILERERTKYGDVINHEELSIRGESLSVSKCDQSEVTGNEVSWGRITMFGSEEIITSEICLYKGDQSEVTGNQASQKKRLNEKNVRSDEVSLESCYNENPGQAHQRSSECVPVKPSQKKTDRTDKDVRLKVSVARKLPTVPEYKEKFKNTNVFSKDHSVDKSLNTGGFVDKIVDTYENIDSGDGTAKEGKYARKGTYKQKNVKGVVAMAEAGIGNAYAKNGMCVAEAKGLNANAMAKATVLGAEAGAKASLGEASANVGPIVGASVSAPSVAANAYVKWYRLSTGAEIDLTVAKASANVGPIEVTAGLSLDTGLSLGPTGISVKVLGCGFKIGATLSLTIFGTGFQLF